MGAEHVEQAGSQGTESRHDGDGTRQRESQALPNTGRGIRPTTTVPPTVLMTELDNGTLILQGRPDGPRVSLNPADTMPLRYELARAFGSTAAFTTRNDEGDAS